MTLTSVARESPPPAPLPATSSAPAAWSPLRRIVFRFGAIYWLLFCARALADTSTLEVIASGYVNAWTSLCALVARHVFRMGALQTHATGSGDRIIDYVGLLIIVFVATLGTIVWTLLDRRRQQYERLHDWLRVMVRYSVGFIMFEYGLVKVFPLQFRIPDAPDLLHTYGESSPMRLLWTFMGASPAYVIFSGIGETVGATLVLFRRTTTLGALILIAVLTNVVMLNFCYDVDVKINSAHYLAMCIFLAIPDLRRLADLLLLHRSISSTEWRRTFTSRRRRRIHHVIKYGLLATFMLLTLRWTWREFRDSSVDAPDKPWIDGAWLVKRFARDGKDLPALVDDKSRWRFLTLGRSEGKEYLRWYNMDNSRGPLFTTTVDDARQRIALTRDDEPSTSYALRLSHSDAAHFTLEGKIGDDEISVELERFKPRDAILLSRGFHFINEVPFNR
jgi:uncharacterized membrane protein YphA (DoxX/SURF4 family)